MKTTDTIKLKGFNLRRLRPSDAKSIADNANNIKIARCLTSIFPHPYTLKDAREWIKLNTSAEGRSKMLNLGIEVDNQIVGNIGFGKKHDYKVEFGYWLGERYWGKGITTEAVKAMVKLAFKDKKICRISARVYTDNVGSQKVLEKAGFSLEGCMHNEGKIFGELKDAYLYSIVR
jgi:RimJ/RimL family protein N-acetyltransferase